LVYTKNRARYIYSVATKKQSPRPPVASLPLRQRKFARTRLDLLAALVERMDSRPLEEISVRELCDAASVSEASFFNYFPKKTDLVAYFIVVWALEVGVHVRRAVAAHGARAGIEAIFDVTAEKVAEHPRVMAEVIAFQARMRDKPALGEVTVAERLLAFPELPEVLDVPAQGLDGILPPLIAQAVREGALPAATDRDAAFLLLCSVFFGVPLLLGASAPKQIGPAYRAALDVVWKGLAASRKAPRR